MGLNIPPNADLQQVYPNVPIGRGTYGGLNIYDWQDGTKISVGAYCSFGFEVTVLLGGDHRFDWVTTFPFTAMGINPPKVEGHPRSKGPITIGNDVWVGAQAMILSGVTIGNGAVIGARALVNRDVPSYSIVVGVPAKCIGFRFDEDTCLALEKIAWWNWEPERIERAFSRLLSSDIWAFIHAVRAGVL